MNHKTTAKAFTLLEMLLVIAIIAILAGIVIVAINPGRQLAQSRNAQRWSDIRTLHSAVQQYYIDNKEWPADLETVTSLTEVCNTGTLTSPQTTVHCTGLIDLSELVPEYVPAIPTDPQTEVAFESLINKVYAVTNGTGYTIAIDSNSQTPILTAINSTEYDLEPVQIGTGILNYNNVSLNFTATSENIAYNNSVTISWNAADADSCVTSGDWSNTIGTSGDTTFNNLTTTQAYTLTCSNEYYTTTETLTINVAAALDYTLTYNLNGGDTGPSPESRAELSTANLSPTVPTKTGYTFNSWNTDAAGNGDSYNPSDSFTMPSNDEILYAQWDVAASGCGDPTDSLCWSTSVLNLNIKWSLELVLTGSNSLTNGSSNHTNIIDNYWDGNPYGSSNYPAFAYCENLTDGGNTDWYLPSKQQLTDGLNAQFVGGTVSGFVLLHDYWSSTEGVSSRAWSVNYSNITTPGIYYGYAYKHVTATVEKVRCFR